ncbi:MAG: virulence RhuM family protein [Candidatus Komeilibacteria bacterium]
MKKNNDLVIYQAENGAIEYRGDFERDTIWGNLNQIADLFGVQKAAISKHLKNIYIQGELAKGATVSILETVRIEGSRKIKRKIEYYNLDAIISVGYRVNSKKATLFRIWATKVLRRHLVEGYTINRKRIILL